MAKNEKATVSEKKTHCCDGNIVEHGFKLGFGIFLGFTLGTLLVSGVAVVVYYLVGLI